MPVLVKKKALRRGDILLFFDKDKDKDTHDKRAREKDPIKISAVMKRQKKNTPGETN